MSQQSSASMNLLQQQTHVAQQSRRDKLRIPGSHHPSSPQNYDHSEHSQQSVTAHLGPSSGYLQGYSTNIGQSNIGNAIPTYASYMISSDTYNCPDGAESLALPAKNTGCFVAESVEKSPFVGTIYSGQSQTPMRFNGQANEQSKEGSWISGGPQLGMMTNNGFMNPPSTLNGTTTAVTSAVAANLLSAPSIQTSTYAMNSREGSMGTYFTGSSSQADSVQAFYLMNPGIAGYTDTMASGNMVLINHTTGSALPSTYFTGNGQLQQHFIGIPLSTPSPSQCSSMGAVQNSPAEQQNTTSSLLASRLGAHAYNSWQGGGNELTFLQTTDATSSNQSMSGQLNSSVNLGSQSVTEISQLALRHASMSSLEEQQSGILSSGLGLRLDQPQGSAGRGQGLSLSLSPHQRSTVQLPSFQNQPGELDVNCQTSSEENIYRVDRTANKWTGSLTSIEASPRNGMLGNGVSSSMQISGVSKQMHLDSGSTGVVRFPNILRGSKYLKAAQQLLDEVASLGKGAKSDSAKHHKSQTWVGAVSDKENTLMEAGGKDGVSDAPTTGLATSADETNNKNATELTPAERQELQIKKTKLVTMLDEVDRRYSQYYHRMHIVVSSFEAASEFGAAKTYTALALQTISKHFRCLRDAITGQIRLTSKSLGEEDIVGSHKGETSCLRFMDQQLRQQRALQQLGVIQQHAWRPQRGLPERSVSVLRAWLFEHFLHPYPKDADKHMLARQAGLTRGQVSNWFINARVRLWKPMVEEMYMEENKEAELGHVSSEKAGKESAEDKEDAESEEGSGNSQNAHDQELTKAMQLSSSEWKEGHKQQNDAASVGLKSEHSSDMMNCRNQTFSMDGASDEEVSHEAREEGMRQGQLKKARNGIQDTTHLLCTNLGTVEDFKSKETHPEDICDKFSDETQVIENYSLVKNSIVHADNSRSFGSYQIGRLNRYGQDSFAPRFPRSGSVSLSLGLPHSDGLSLPGTQQSCISSQGRKHDLSSAADGYCNINETAAVHAANACESNGIQNRKRFATHLVHDFVA
eukprot:Gb_01695 [translate_table: standard]